MSQLTCAVHRARVAAVDMLSARFSARLGLALSLVCCPVFGPASNAPLAVAQDTAPRAGKNGVEDTGPPAEPRDPATRVTLATIKIANERSMAAGFFVSLPADMADKQKPRECVLVTAHHVFEQCLGPNALLLLRKRQPNATYNRVDMPVKIREGEMPRWVRHPQHDVAALRVILPPDVATQPLPHGTLADERAVRKSGLHVGSRVLTFGYPMRLEANSAGFPIVRQGGIASFPFFPVALHPTMFIDMNAFAGDSGGPVIATPADRTPAERGPANASSGKNGTANGNSVSGGGVNGVANGMAHSGSSEVIVDEPLVLGLITGQVRHDERTTGIMEERVTHYPLGVALMIQAQFIRETIALLANAGQ